MKNGTSGEKRRIVLRKEKGLPAGKNSVSGLKITQEGWKKRKKKKRNNAEVSRKRKE